MTTPDIFIGLKIHGSKTDRFMTAPYGCLPRYQMDYLLVIMIVFLLKHVIWLN